MWPLTDLVLYLLAFVVAPVTGVIAVYAWWLHSARLFALVAAGHSVACAAPLVLSLVMPREAALNASLAVLAASVALCGVQAMRNWV